MEEILKYRNEIYGFLALWILFFHVETRVGMIDIPILTSFVQKGNFGVDAFLFLSGYCLCLSLQRDSNVSRFYSRRFKRIIISYLIISVPFFIWKSIEEVSTYKVANFFYDLSGLSFWLSGCQNAWFVEAIIAFCLVAPLAYNIVKYGARQSMVILAIVYLLLIGAHYLFPFVHRCEIALARFPVFFIGIIIAYWKPKCVLKHKRLALLLCIIVISSLLLYKPGHTSGFWIWLLYVVMVLPVLWLLKYFFQATPQYVRFFFKKIGDVSLEVYLTLVMILHIFTFYGMNEFVGMWMFILLPVIALPLSLMIPYMVSYVCNLVVMSNHNN